MMEKTKSYKIHIFGDEYALVSSEPEEHVIQAARLVDSLMKELSGKAPLAQEKKIAVLAALRIASSLLEKEAALAALHTHEQSLIELVDKTLASHL